MVNRRSPIAAGLLAVALNAPVTAGVILTENITNTGVWPEVVDINTRAPAGLGTGGSTSATTTLAQTFTAPESGLLDVIYLQYSGGAGTYKISLFEIPEAIPQTYTAGTDLFDPTGTTPLTITGTVSVSGTVGLGALMKLELTDDDRVAVESGKFYALEVARVSGGDIALRRQGSSTYAGGAAYSNRSGVNWPNHRDWSTAAIITVPEPSAALVLWGAVSLWAGRRRRAELA